MFKLLKKCIGFIVILSILVVDVSIFYMPTYAEDRVAYVKGTGVNVRKGGSTSHEVIGQVNAGDRVVVKGSINDSSNKVWYQIDFNGKTGYIRYDYVYFPKQYVYDADFENKLSRQKFPEDYKEYLRLLHAEYPLWEFEAFNTGLDFNYAVDMEDEGTRSLVTTGAISSYKSTEDGKFDWNTSTWPTFDGKAWVCASKDIIKYYMDPRNFLVDPYVFQYEKQTFDSTIHTLEGVNEMLKGSFLDSTLKTTGNADKLVNVVTDNNQSTPINYNYQENNNAVAPSMSQTPQVPQAPTTVETPGPGSVNNTNNNINGPSGMTEQTDANGNVIPILKNTDEDTMISFASTIYAPGINIQNAIPPSQVEEEYEEKSFYFTYLPAGDHTYAEIIYDACRQVGISPYVVVAMILQEQGKDGKSDLISGTKAGYKNLYNYGSIGAFASGGKTAIENGLTYASTEGSYNRPWNTKEKAIYGIIDYYAHSFIKRGQDTFYLKKWNVQGSDAFKHQYMTNVLAAASEGQLLSKAYDDNLKYKKHIMKIPIYQNMPANRCEKPTKDGNPNNKLKDLKVDGYSLTPTFNKDINNYTLIVPENTKNVKVSATKIHGKATVSGTGNVMLSTAITTVVVRVAAENGDIREYNIMVYTPGAVNNMGVVDQIQQQEAPLIIPNVLNDIDKNNLVTSPPMSNAYKPIGPGDVIYGVLN